MKDQPKRFKGKSQKCDYWWGSHPLKVLSTIIILLSISACSFMASAAKETTLSVTGRNGWKTFNLTGELPPEFGVKAIVWYAPIKPSASCEVDDFYSSKKRIRTHAQVYEKDYNSQPHTFNFKVALTYSVGLCAMEIASVDLKINGRFGGKEWQQAYDDGGLRFVESLPVNSPEFNQSGVLDIFGKCEWLFRDMPARGELVKILKCKGAGAYLQTDQLADKTVKFKIEISPNEKPTVRNRWINGNGGWKPCQGTPESDRCQVPPIFKKFQMNGNTCTIYPGCKEQ